MKYALKQVVFCILDNKVHSAPALARTAVENLYGWESTRAQRETFMPFGNSGKYYATCHGVFPEEQLSASKEDLLRSL